jgi:hypothetical protein
MKYIHRFEWINNSVLGWELYKLTYPRSEMKFEPHQMLQLPGIEDDLIMAGHLKFDGCMNASDEGTMLHFCDKDDIDELADMLKRIYSDGRQLFGDRWAGPSRR